MLKSFILFLLIVSENFSLLHERAFQDGRTSENSSRTSVILVSWEGKGLRGAGREVVSAICR